MLRQGDKEGLERRAVLGLFGAAAAVPIAGVALGDSAHARLGAQLVAVLGRDAAAAVVAEDAGEAAGAYTARVAADFRNGRTLLLDGFVIARTEAAAWLRAAGVGRA